MIDRIDADQVRKHAVDAGMLTLREAGLRKVAQGETTLEEVMSIVADQD